MLTAHRGTEPRISQDCLAHLLPMLLATFEQKFSLLPNVVFGNPLLNVTVY